MTRLSFATIILLCSSFSLSAQKADTVLPKRPIRFSMGQLSIPVGLLGAGILLNNNATEGIKKEVAEERNEYIPGFKTHIDNYLQYSPIVIAYALDAAGIKSRTDFANRTAILIKGEAMMFGVVTILKNTTHQLRPDGTTYNSFPSGHTAQAFAAAAFLSEEYRDRFRWMPYAAYGLASSVGMMRIANNRHYISDVFAGAAIGILSMKASYWTHNYHWGKKRNKVMTNPLAGY